MTRKPKGIPTLAEHRARPPIHLGRLEVDKNGHLHITPGDPAVVAAYLNNVRQHWGPNLIDNVERQMVAILAAAGLPTEADVITQTDRGRFRGLEKRAEHTGHQVGSEVWYAAKTVEQIVAARTAKAGDQRDHEWLHLGILLCEANIQVANGNTLDRGERFDPRSHGRRRDALARAIDEAFDKLGGDARASSVFDYVSNRPFVQDVDSDRTISWQDDRQRLRDTGFERFCNRVSAHRKLWKKSHRA